MKRLSWNKVFLVFTGLFLQTSFAGNKWYAKDPFVTLRKKPSPDSHAISTVTCAARLSEHKNGVTSKVWIRVKTGKVVGFVKKNAVTKTKGGCLSQKERLIFNSLSLSAEDIYFWAKLNEHFIPGAVNENF